jgi:hypothetical protein
MDFNLLCHAHTPMPAIDAVRVQAQRQHHGRMAIHYAILGDISQIMMPIIMAQERADDLWRTTCFELFLTAGCGQYLELNFSPSSRWAAYLFEGYRSGRRNTDMLTVSRLDIQASARSLELGVVVDLAPMTAATTEADWVAGFSAVIEARDGAKSYWALAHPPGEPDFHHEDCFAAILTAPMPE